MFLIPERKRRRRGAGKITFDNFDERERESVCERRLKERMSNTKNKLERDYGMREMIVAVVYVCILYTSIY